MVNTRNIFIHGQNSKFITSHVVIASITNKHGRTELDAPQIDIKDVHQQGTSRQSSLQRVTPRFTPGDADQLFYHSAKLRSAKSSRVSNLAPKRDKSWTFSDHISVCFLSLSPGFVLRDVRFGLKVGRFSIQWDKSETF